MVRVVNLYDLSRSRLGDYLANFMYPWEALEGLKDCIRERGRQLPANLFRQVGEDVWIAHTATIAPTAAISGPCIIDGDAQIRHGAFIRGSVMVGKGAVVGNSVELKNCILFDGVQVPHYNYVGDSVLGYKAHMGAGAVTSNVKSDKSFVVIRGKDVSYPTNRKKCGAMLGDGAEIGCNSVLNPGAVIGRFSQVYPTSCVRGVVPANHIYKDAQHIVEKRSD